MNKHETKQIYLKYKYLYSLYTTFCTDTHPARTADLQLNR